MTVDYKITRKKRDSLRLVKIIYSNGDYVDWWTAGSDEEIAEKFAKLQTRVADKDNPKFQVTEDIA